MTTARNFAAISESTVKSLVHIDTQDEYYINALREYLITHGCEVKINRDTDIVPLYHLICGDEEFVKKNFSKRNRDQRKHLLLIWEGPPAGRAGTPEIGRILAGDNVKIVLLDPKPLNEAQVRQLFTFFFTGTAAILDWRSKTTVRRHQMEEVTIVAHERKSESDSRRISETIASVFGGNTSKTKPGITKPLIRRMSWLAVLILVFLAPFFWYLASLSLNVVTLGLAAKWLAEGKAVEANRVVALSEFWTGQGQISLRMVGLPLRLVGLTRQIQGQEQLVSFLRETAAAEKGMVQILTRGRELASTLLIAGPSPNTSGAPATNLEKLRLEVVAVQNHLGLAYAQLKYFLMAGTFPFSLPPVYRLGSRSLNLLVGLRQTTQQVENLLLLLPLAGGFREKQIYLVLLQNDAELRPSGGFIGSLALVTLAEGKLSDLTIQDVYAVDGQLKGHVDPPRPLKELLGQEHWYLRDSNWDPDFRVSAGRAAWFFEKETGIKVDGVIALNTRLIVDLLRATGPLELSDYNDRITADNFFGKSLFYMQTDFFPGSTQKKDFLGSLTSALITKLMSNKGVSPAAVFQAMAAALTRHDILFYFFQPQLQAIVEQANWAGKVITKESCFGTETEPCFLDYVAAVEANLGVNKANYFVKRSVLQQIALGEDGVPTETLALTYRNTSASDPASGGGNYRAYLRLILPSDSQISWVTFDGQRLSERDPKQTGLPKLPFFEAEINKSSHILGIAFDLASGKEGRLVVAFRRGSGLVFGAKGASYELFIPKQPGAIDTPWQIVVKYPIFWAAAGNSIAKPGVIEYNTLLSHDETWRINFLK